MMRFIRPATRYFVRVRPDGTETLLALEDGVTGHSWHDDIGRWVADVPELWERTVQGLDELLTELTVDEARERGAGPLKERQ